MEFAFLDESGDNGKNGSKYLVLTLLCTNKRKQLVKIIRETKRQLLRNNKKIEKITVDLNFFNKDKENYFKLIKSDSTPNKGIQSILYFTKIDKKHIMSY